MGRRTEKREFVDLSGRSEIEAKIEDTGAISLSQDGNMIYFAPEDIEDVVDLIRSVDPRRASNTKETPHE